MMAKVIVEGMQEDLWPWWMTRIMEGKFFIGKKVTNMYSTIMYLLFYKVHSDCCGKLWSQKTDRLWPEARGLHQADP